MKNLEENFYIPNNTYEKKLKEMLIGHSVKKINNSILELDNGIQLEFTGNYGCCCGSGEYDITELNECSNIITNVEFVDNDNIRGTDDGHSYKIFVYAENQKIKLLQCDGDDGNGYYGTGYDINIKFPADKVLGGSENENN